MEEIVDLGDLKREVPTVPWILILGGLSRAGNRRARRVVAGVVGRGAVPVWIDGFDERREEDGERVVIDGLADDARVLVVPCAEQERSLSEHGFTMRCSRWVGGTYSALERRRVATPVVRRGRGAAKLLERSLARAGGVGRGRRLWHLLRPELDSIDLDQRPTAVVYCDDYALTSAWYLSRRWPDVEASGGPSFDEAPT